MASMFCPLCDQKSIPACFFSFLAFSLCHLSLLWQISSTVFVFFFSVCMCLCLLWEREREREREKECVLLFSWILHKWAFWRYGKSSVQIFKLHLIYSSCVSHIVAAWQNDDTVKHFLWSKSLDITKNKSFCSYCPVSWKKKMVLLKMHHAENCWDHQVFILLKDDLSLKKKWRPKNKWKSFSFF